MKKLRLLFIALVLMGFSGIYSCNSGETKDKQDDKEVVDPNDGIDEVDDEGALG